MNTISFLRRTIAVACVAVTAVGCSLSGGDDPGGPSSANETPKPVKSGKICGALIGKSGEQALEKLSQSAMVLPATGKKSSRLERVVAGMKATAGKEARRNPVSVCTFSAPPEGISKTTVDFSFGWGDEPDKVPEKHLLYSAGSALVSVDSNPNARADLYYKCKISTHSVGIVAGEFRGDWASSDLTSVEKDKLRVRIFLSAASKVADALNCKNDPGLSPESEIELLNGDHKVNAPPLDWPELPA